MANPEELGEGQSQDILNQPAKQQLNETETIQEEQPLRQSTPVDSNSPIIEDNFENSLSTNGVDNGDDDQQQVDNSSNLNNEEQETLNKTSLSNEDDETYNEVQDALVENNLNKEPIIANENQEVNNDEQLIENEEDIVANEDNEHNDVFNHSLVNDTIDNGYPFSPVAGEKLICDATTIDDDGDAYVTNYRVYVSTQEGSKDKINIPIGWIESVNQIFPNEIEINCKIGSSYTILLDLKNYESFYSLLKHQIAVHSNNRTNTYLFPFSHKSAAEKKNIEEFSNVVNLCKSNYRNYVDKIFDREFRRLNFDEAKTWRISEVNKGFKLCKTYPEKLIVPAWISDDTLRKVGQFRSSGRIPAVVWRDGTTGAVIARSSQPEVGFFCSRSFEDEKLVNDISMASFKHSLPLSDTDSKSANDTDDYKDLSEEASSMGSSKKLIIMDARSYAAALSNRARGGGMEYIDYYVNCTIEHMYLANIHSVRNSYNQFRKSFDTPDETFFQNIGASKWLSNLSTLLKSAIRCASLVHKGGNSVLVHCTDGWDRTTQIVTLAKLLLDPFYRTLEGFQVLIESDWISFGHKMADRCGSVFGCEDTNERSPIFLQWLDAVHQIVIQYPTHFEFNVIYLLKIAQHTYSNLFGTFLCNSLFQKLENDVHTETRSVFDFIRVNSRYFSNPLFHDTDDDLWPLTDECHLAIWKEAYFLQHNPSNGKSSPSSKEDTNQTDATKINLTKDQDSKDSLTPASEVKKENVSKESNAVEKKCDQSEQNCEEQKSPSPSPSVFTSASEAAAKTKRFDTDGLLSMDNIVDMRTQNMIARMENHIHKLEVELKSANDALTKNGLEHFVLINNPDIEHSSGFQTGSSSSEASWEAVDDRDDKTVMWVPDHSLNSCMGCYQNFWFGRRKHHCRACGGLFCYSCAPEFVKLPQEYLNEPVRVCSTCYINIPSKDKTKIEKDETAK